jgi:C4-dicarboxylate transporter, DctM subunit
VIAFFFILLAVLLVTGLPMFISLSGAVAGALLLQGDPMAIIAHRMFGGLDKFALMAIPFFIFAANLMGRGGISARVIRLANALVGPIHGGLGITAVVACMFFAAISGSAPATVIAIGALMLPALVSAGYGKDFSIGLITSAGSLGIVIPPSVVMIVYGAATGVSVGKLFMAGFGAGAVMGLVFIAYAWFYGRSKGLKGEPWSRKAIGRAARDSMWGLGVPGLILGGIYGGIFTPTEAAAVAVIYSLAVSLFVYREIGMGEVWAIAVDSAVTTAQVMILLAAANVLAYYFTVERFTVMITEWVVSFGATAVMVYLLVNIVVLIAGMFVDGASIVMILGPLLLPIAKKVGIDPVHLGVVLTLNTAIGMFTPPFGLNLFAAVGVSNQSILKVSRAVLPFILVSLLALAVVTYVPAVSMFLPQLLGGK